MPDIAAAGSIAIFGQYLNLQQAGTAIMGLQLFSSEVTLKEYVLLSTCLPFKGKQYTDTP